MYFIETPLFDQLQAAGLDVPNHAWGRFALTRGHRHVAGVVINPDALTLDRLNGYAEAVGGTAFSLNATRDGFWDVQLQSAAPDRLAAGDGDDAATSGAESNASTHRAPRPRRFVEITNEDTGVSPATSAAMRLVELYRSRLSDRAIRLLRPRAATTANSLPKLDTASDISVALNTCPGRKPNEAPRPITIQDIVTEQTHTLHIPQANLPGGMTPIAVEGVPVAASGPGVFALFVDDPTLVALLLPAWLEGQLPDVATPPQADDATIQRSAERLAAESQRAQPSRAHTMHQNEQSLRKAQQDLSRYRQRRELLEAELARQPAAPDAETVKRALMQAVETGGWELVVTGTHRVDIKLREAEVADPRGGRRRMPKTPTVALDDLLRGNPPLKVNWFAHNQDSDYQHPRLIAGSFASEEIADAVSEMGRAGDVAGALELIRDVLTQFAPEDPDVVALDAWDLVEDTPDSPETTAEGDDGDARAPDQAIAA